MPQDPKRKNVDNEWDEQKSLNYKAFFATLNNDESMGPIGLYHTLQSDPGIGCLNYEVFNLYALTASELAEWTAKYGCYPIEFVSSFEEKSDDDDYGSEQELKTHSDGGSANASKPSHLDYFIDVERAVECTIPNKFLLQKFKERYIFGLEGITFGKEELNQLIQKVGYEFRKRRIAPASRYFTTIKRRVKS